MDEKQEITLSALSPVFQDKRFIGVMVSDVKLNTFNQFLSELKQRMNADVYVMDKQHRLIAHSGEGSVVSWGTPLSPKGERLFASENRNPIIRSSAEQLDLQGLNVGTFTTYVNQQRYFNQASAFTDQYGLTWYISVSIAEGDLLGSLPEIKNQLGDRIISELSGFRARLNGIKPRRQPDHFYRLGSKTTCQW